MALFEKQLETSTPPAKTPETAMEIYSYLKQYNGSCSAVFSGGYGYPMTWIKWVYCDAKRLECEIFNYILNNPNCSAAEVIANLSSLYLTVDSVGTDVIHYNPTFDETRTFAQFKLYILG